MDNIYIRYLRDIYTYRKVYMLLYEYIYCIYVLNCMHGFILYYIIFSRLY